MQLPDVSSTPVPYCDALPESHVLIQAAAERYEKVIEEVASTADLVVIPVIPFNDIEPRKLVNVTKPYTGGSAYKPAVIPEELKNATSAPVTGTRPDTGAQSHATAASEAQVIAFYRAKGTMGACIKSFLHCLSVVGYDAKDMPTITDVKTGAKPRPPMK